MLGNYRVRKGTTIPRPSALSVARRGYNHRWTAPEQSGSGGGDGRGGVVVVVDVGATVEIC